jgi:hypothetical protein
VRVLGEKRSPVTSWIGYVLPARVGEGFGVREAVGDGVGEGVRLRVGDGFADADAVRRAAGDAVAATVLVGAAEAVTAGAAVVGSRGLGELRDAVPEPPEQPASSRARRAAERRTRPLWHVGDANGPRRKANSRGPRNTA